LFIGEREGRRDRDSGSRGLSSGFERRKGFMFSFGSGLNLGPIRALSLTVADDSAVFLLHLPLSALSRAKRPPRQASEHHCGRRSSLERVEYASSA